MPAKSSSTRGRSTRRRSTRVDLPTPCTFENQITRLITDGLQVHAEATTTFSVCTDCPVPPSGLGEEVLMCIDTDYYDESWVSILQALVFAPMHGSPLAFTPADYVVVFPGTTRRRFYFRCINVGNGTGVAIRRQVSGLISHVNNPANLFHLANPR